METLAMYSQLIGPYATVLEELMDYSKLICSGDIIACNKHKQACKRFLEDLEKMADDNWDYYWDESEAQRVVKWYSYCRHSKGPLEKQPIELNPWQKFVVCNIEAWKHKDTEYRRFKFAFIEVARKNSKSQLEAGMASYECGARKHNAAEIYTLGVERDQARVVFDEVELMLSKPLKKRFKIIQKEIRHKNSSSFIRHLSKKAGKTGDGKNPQMAIIDEYHAHPDSKMYDVMRSGMGARPEPLLVVITTAGEDFEDSACYAEYKDCSSILNGDIINERYFVMICELDEDDDPWDDKNWPKANPVVCSYEQGYDNLRIDAQTAKDSTSDKKRNDFLTKNCNIYIESGAKRYMKVDYWHKTNRKITMEDFRGMECYIGLDLSKTGDLTSLAFEFPFLDDGQQMYALFGMSFIPEMIIKEKSKTDNASYKTWIKKDYLIDTKANDGLIVDYWEVIGYIERMTKTFDLHVAAIGYDPHNASLLVAELENRGYPCIEIGQSCAKLDEPTINFRDEMTVGHIIHPENGLMAWSLNNCEEDTNSFGEIKLSKKSRFKRIDPIACSIFSHKLAMQHWNNDTQSTNQAVDDFIEMAKRIKSVKGGEKR